MFTFTIPKLNDPDLRDQNSQSSNPSAFRLHITKIKFCFKHIMPPRILHIMNYKSLEVRVMNKKGSSKDKIEKGFIITVSTLELVPTT
jgi:hypothetical protein